MIQSQQQIVSLFVRRGARDRSVEVNIDKAREIRSEALSGERSEKSSSQALYVSSNVAQVVQEQLGVSMAQIMSDEFSDLVDWLSGSDAPAAFPFLEALLIIGGSPAALVK